MDLKQLQKCAVNLTSMGNTKKNEEVLTNTVSTDLHIEEGFPLEIRNDEDKTKNTFTKPKLDKPIFL